MKCLCSGDTCVLSPLESAAKLRQVDMLHQQITSPRHPGEGKRQTRCNCHRFHHSSSWQKTEQFLFCKCKLKIYITTPNPPKLPRDIELMGSVKVFHTCVFLLCLILWEAFWRILQPKFQWDTSSLPQANCHSCRGLLPSCQSRQAGRACRESAASAGSLDCWNLTRGYRGVLQPLEQAAFRKRDFFLSFPTREKALTLIEECAGANFPLSNFNVCFAFSKKRNYIAL